MRLLFVLAALSLARAALAAEGGELTAWAGLGYSSGSYGGPGETEILSIPFAARYENGPWTLRATVPWLSISGSDATVVPGVGRLGRGQGTRTVDTTSSGMGDASASATYTVYGAGERSGAGLTGKLKLATGDENQGLGTGSTDLSVQGDLFRSFGEATFFGGVGYTMFGDSAVVHLDDVVNASLGLVQRLPSSDRLGLALDVRQAGSPLPAAQRELSAFWLHRMDARWRLNAYLLKGFADGSPDWGGGLSAGYAF